MTSKTNYFLIGTCCALAIIAFLFGRSSVETNPKSDAPFYSADEVDRPSEPDAVSTRLNPTPTKSSKTKHSPEELAEGNSDPNIQTYEYEQALVSVDNLKNLLKTLPESADKQVQIQSLMQSLLAKAEGNSNTLRGIVDAYKQDPDSRSGAVLQNILAELKDPEVEQAALSMSQSTDEAEQLAGLDLMAKLDIPSEESFQITSNIIAAEQNSPEVMMAAIHALPDMPIAPEEREPLLMNISRLAENSTDPGVRSASIFKVGEMAKDADELYSVTELLNPDNQTDDRISAAMAIKQSSVVDDSVKTVLVDRMTDPNELWEIRRLSAQALERFKLESDDYTAYQEFLDEQGDVSLGQ